MIWHCVYCFENTKDNVIFILPLPLILNINLHILKSLNITIKHFYSKILVLKREGIKNPVSFIENNMLKLYQLYADESLIDNKLRNFWAFSMNLYYEKHQQQFRNPKIYFKRNKWFLLLLVTIIYFGKEYSVLYWYFS